MKTFFSIIYISLNTALKERISVGLIMSDGEKDFFKISETKLNVIKNLIPHQNFLVLRTYFKSLDKEINSTFDELKLNIKNKKTEWITESYISYLHRYTNNLVNFSDFKTIDLPLNQENFKRIFEKYIFSFEEIEEINYKIFHIEDTIRLELYPKIENNVNLETVITPNDFEELITPVEIGFIGKNGTIVAGQAIDFSKRHYNLENDLTKFISFTKAADYKQSFKGTYFVVGEEPSKKENPQNHTTWKHVKESKLIKYVDINETEEIEEYLKRKEVTPYFD